jgi:hypothetical protein
MLRSMISPSSQVLRRSIGTVALVAALIGCFAAASPASARVWIGFGFPGIYVGPPAYPYYYPPPAYYPPAYYPPPPVSYAPNYAPQSYAQPQSGPASGAAGQSCNAGSYTCPMDQPVASGAACYCPGNGGTRVWGHAN